MVFETLFNNLWSPREDDDELNPKWGRFAYILFERLKNHPEFTHVVYFIPADNWKVHKTYCGFKKNKAKKNKKFSLNYNNPKFWSVCLESLLSKDFFIT